MEKEEQTPLARVFTDKKTGQLSFFELSEHFDKSTRLWQEFMDFHTNNPCIYERYKEEIVKAINDGREMYSISIITEHHRWDKKYKMSNNHRAYYARLFIEDHPEYKSFFRLRPIKQD